ncbi:MAG: tautomerase family protein [Thermoplasmata archaeon]|nr:tautomerase family protein [Thermoplasmata archaeon]
MPVVIVNMYAGRDRETKRRIAEGITEVFEKENVPRDAVTVIMNDVPKDNWANSGRLASDLQKCVDAPNQKA